MKTFRLALLASIAFCSHALGQEAGTITFAAQTVTGAGSVVPILTWSTAPAAQSCAATGDWAGSKSASGTETLPAITTSRTYNLQCTWPAGNSVTINWTPATLNTDGSNYTDPKLVRIFYGLTPTTMTTTKDVPVPALSTTISPLAAGTWNFCARSVNQADVPSDCTGILTKTLSPSTVSRTVGIVVNPKPNPPSGLTVQ